MTKLTLQTDGETQVIITRHFAAKPELVYRAHIEPDLIRRWMFGRDGWNITDCISDARPGGEIRFVFVGPAGETFSLTGTYKTLIPAKSITHVERMHLPDPTPDNHILTTFTPDGDGTLLKLVMTLPDAATRTAMLETGMADGMEESYARIDPLFA